MSSLNIARHAVPELYTGVMIHFRNLSSTTVRQICQMSISNIVMAGHLHYKMANLKWRSDGDSLSDSTYTL